MGLLAEPGGSLMPLARTNLESLSERVGSVPWPLCPGQLGVTQCGQRERSGSGSPIHACPGSPASAAAPHSLLSPSWEQPGLCSGAGCERPRRPTAGPGPAQPPAEPSPGAAAREAGCLVQWAAPGHGVPRVVSDPSPMGAGQVSIPSPVLGVPGGRGPWKLAAYVLGPGESVDHFQGSVSVQTCSVT